MTVDPRSALRELLKQNPGGQIHLLGIGGVGMAGLAGLLNAQGFTVSGCDKVANRLTLRLNQAGISTAIGHDPAHLDQRPFLVIRSTALPVNHPEIAAANAASMPVYRRGEVLAVLLESYTSVAISGTHGKTTTTALTTHVLRATGERPSFFIGGEWEQPGCVYGEGPGRVMVAEADESDGTLKAYHPDIAVITGIDFDHMEHFENEAAFIAVFEAFARQTRQQVIYCADHVRLASWMASRPNAISYGFAPEARWRATALKESPEGSSFEVWLDGECLGVASLSVPGRHNVQNALAALAVAQVLGRSMIEAMASLKTFLPVRRRLERVGGWHGAAIYSDYAHHPTEIRALIQSVRQKGYRRVLAIFQPHRYTRTRALGADFPASFEGVDHLVLAPVYAASEDPLEGGATKDLEAHFKADGRMAVQRVDQLNEAWPLVRDQLGEGDVLLLVGAGDVDQIAEVIRREQDNDANTV